MYIHIYYILLFWSLSIFIDFSVETSTFVSFILFETVLGRPREAPP